MQKMQSFWRDNNEDAVVSVGDVAYGGCIEVEMLFNCSQIHAK